MATAPEAPEVVAAPVDAAADLPQTRVVHVLRRVVEDNWSAQRAAREMELPYAVVEQVLLDHGGPDKTRLRWALDELTHPTVPGDADTDTQAPSALVPRPRFDPTAVLARGLASTNKALASRANLRDALEGAERNDLAVAVAKVRAIHAPVDAFHTLTGRRMQVCSGCGRDRDWMPWPCPTVQAIGGLGDD